MKAPNTVCNSFYAALGDLRDAILNKSGHRKLVASGMKRFVSSYVRYFGYSAALFVTQLICFRKYCIDESTYVNIWVFFKGLHRIVMCAETEKKYIAYFLSTFSQEPVSRYFHIIPKNAFEVVRTVLYSGYLLDILFQTAYSGFKLLS